MASPHTAGMLAYLLSIYPSVSFDPKHADHADLSARTLLTEAVEIADPGFGAVLALARSVLPTWVSQLIPERQKVELKQEYKRGDDVAPVPGTLSPKALKKALLELSTQNALTDLPAGTPNLVCPISFGLLQLSLI